MNDPAKSTTSIGNLLLEQGKLTEKQLQLAQRRQERLHVPLHRAIVELNYASEEDTYRALARLKNLDFVECSQLQFDQATLQLAPAKLVFHYRFIPLAETHGQLTLAFSEPPALSDQGNLRLLLGKRLKLVLTTPSCIDSVIKHHFGLGAETIQKIQDDSSLTEIDQETVFDVSDAGGRSEIHASISDFVDQLLAEALRQDATDIHLEPGQNDVRLRYRIDGILQRVPVPQGLRQLYGAIVSRFKIMAGLDIAEKRVPQDGRISMKTKGLEYDLRVSTLPTSFGEGICLRILGRQSLFLDLAQLGLEPQQEEILSQLTQLPGGLVLITGPTGSGKTTTLYAALAQANDEGRKIITIEDPVEYQLEGVSQIQARDEVGLTFSTGLRSVLRHDPDVILIGEIRDPETAEIAIRAAQTGHLVFSTLHTNDSVSAVIRLLEMDIDPFLISSSLVASLAQRLAQRICLHCRAPQSEIPEEVRPEMADALNLPEESLQAFVGKGCVECGQRGYRGRVGLYELFILNDEIADYLSPNLKAGGLRQLAQKYGWQPLRHNAWTKVQNGSISIQELQRLTRRVTLQP